MIAIRGATTVDCDRAQDIKEAVGELLLKIREENGLNDSEIVCITFSSTADLHSYYPAKAAREAGFAFCALFSSAEPVIDGSLEKCIRVMVLAEKNGKAKHIYLRGAKKLRCDITEVYNVAVDGPAGSGKSTVCKILGNKLDILCLDTGATYRACALACLEAGIDVNDEKAVSSVLNNADIDVKYREGAQTTLLNGENVSRKIRSPQVSMCASTVSAHRCVREKMVALQRRIAESTSCILDGRDIGTNVLPNANFKFFLTASVEVRAKRRADENAAKGIKQPFETVLEEIKKRDKQDETRALAPLKAADDAIILDTSDMNIDEVVSFMLEKIQEKF